MEEQRRRARKSRDHDQIGWTSKESEHYYEDLNTELSEVTVPISPTCPPPSP